jgi:phage terminase small subunit
LGGRGRRISEFEASLVYSVSSRTGRTTQRNPVLKKKTKTKTKSKQQQHNNNNPMLSQAQKAVKQYMFLAIQLGLCGEHDVSQIR